MRIPYLDFRNKPTAALTREFLANGCGSGVHFRGMMRPQPALAVVDVPHRYHAVGAAGLSLRRVGKDALAWLPQLVRDVLSLIGMH